MKRCTINDYTRRHLLEDILVDDFDMLYRMFARRLRKTFDKSHSSFEEYENNTKTFGEYITIDSSFSSFVEFLKDYKIRKIQNRKLRSKR